MNLVLMIHLALATSLLTLALPLAILAHCRTMIVPLTTVVLPGGTHGRYVPMYLLLLFLLCLM